MNRRSQKRCLIALVLLSAVLFSLTACGGNSGEANQDETEPPLDEEWAQMYYEYLKDHKVSFESNYEEWKKELPDKLPEIEKSTDESEVDEVADDSLDDSPSVESTIGFYKIEGFEYPMMVLFQKGPGISFCYRYLIEDGTVTEGSSFYAYSETAIVFLYNIERQEYSYYIHQIMDDSSTGDDFHKLTSEEQSTDAESSLYGYYPVDGGPIWKRGENVSSTLFPYTFIEIDVPDNSQEYREDFTDSEIRNAIAKSAAEYVAAGDVREAAEKQVAEIQAQQQTEQQAQQTEPEPREPQAAPESVGLQIGGIVVPYGTYAGEAASTGETLVLNPDGTATYNGAPCSVSIESYNFAQDSSSDFIKDALILTDSSGQIVLRVYPYSSENLTDGGVIGFVYTGN